MAKAVIGGLEIVSGLLLLALMGVTGMDVVGRYLFARPLAGAFETTELLLGALVFAALPLVSRSGAHVEVDLLDAFLAPRARRALLWIGAGVSLLVLAFFAWRLTLLGLQQSHDGTRSISLAIPFAPVSLFGAAACLAAAAFGLLRVYRP